jgi:benzodiazapine receptor
VSVSRTRTPDVRSDSPALDRLDRLDELHRGDPPSTARSIVAALLFAAVTVAVAVGGSLINSGSMDWYDDLDKPAFTPPGATFGIVWTILYVMIAISGWLGWRAAATSGDETSPALVGRPTPWWLVQMALNFAWTAVFFGLESPPAGLVVIAALILAVAVDMVVVSRSSRAAAWLLVPYLLWCGFATALNVGILVLN